MKNMTYVTCIVMALCNQPEVFSLDFGDNQSRHLPASMYKVEWYKLSWVCVYWKLSGWV